MVYPNFGYIIPYFWMPKYVNANDASARTLEIYNDNVDYVDNVDNVDNVDQHINLTEMTLS